MIPGIVMAMGFYGVFLDTGLIEHRGAWSSPTPPSPSRSAS